MKHRLPLEAGGGPALCDLSCLCLCALLLAAPVRGREPQAAARHPATPGRLTLEGLGDPRVLAPVVDETSGVRSWSWSWGALTVLADSVSVTLGETELSLPYGTDLAGVSRGRRLRFVDGVYPVDGPLLLRGDAFLLYVSRGELAISDGRIVLAVRPPRRHPAAQYLLFLGVLLLTMFMMMKARARLKAS